MSPQVCIIDYGIGNVGSVKNALQFLGVSTVISSDKKMIQEATHLILPGVGSFGDGMRNLKERNLVDILKEEVIVNKKKILGICLGMQLFASHGFEHGEFEGLDFISGKIIQIDITQSKLRLPHIGWNNVTVVDDKVITKSFEQEPIFYFVHSFHFIPEERSVVAGICTYGHDIVALVESGNIFGTQFHPEKSHVDGLHVLKNFINA